ncbi:outer spore coat protein CotE [Cerasibacillus terrae]|uniref:Outer spore coat protein CotE n=1 Tax=Cerasibacillus terrae TaxID=2498845 RepID=A0A5C8P3D0_9BACI|nr:outer spore coat protein CotE [Cerasibacillus terrae]TXL67757.1 outer spore coat protein CotE [Cerasibacillus terrae]
MSFLKKEYREIITKAVCGKGKKFTNETHSVTPSHRPTSILGCWIINHRYHSKKKSEDSVEVNGSYDINIWYSYHDNTKTEVVTERVQYRDIVPLSIKDDHSISNDFDVVCKATQQPNCLECEISKKGDQIKVDTEREFIVQVIGETKVYVKVDPEGNNYVDDDDAWDFAVVDEELEDVDPNFLKNKE